MKLFRLHRLWTMRNATLQSTLKGFFYVVIAAYVTNINKNKYDQD